MILAVVPVAACTDTDVSHKATLTASEIAPTREETTRFLGEMKENLNGHPTRMEFDLVRPSVLVAEGTRACRWLAQQAGGENAFRRDEAVDAYLTAHPRPPREWPFKHPFGVRRQLLSNAWGWLCADVTDARIDLSVDYEHD